MSGSKATVIRAVIRGQFTGEPSYCKSLQRRAATKVFGAAEPEPKCLAVYAEGVDENLLKKTRTRELATQRAQRAQRYTEETKPLSIALIWPKPGG
jgi:hypothetical protein